MQKAIYYLKTNWRDGKTLKEIADLYRVDAGNLERAFRNQEGMTVKHYVDAQRQKHVLAQITGKSMLGYEIGATLGFRSDLAFYRWVKRAFGISFIALCEKAKSGWRKKRTPINRMVIRQPDFAKRAMTRKRNKK